MLKHLVIELSTDGDLDLDAFNTEEEATAFINDRANEIHDQLLEEFSAYDLELIVHHTYARVSVVKHGCEFGRWLEYRSLDV